MVRNFALLGTGSMARVYAKALATLPKVRLKWIHSQTLGRSMQMASEFSCKATDSLDQVASDPEIDAAIVANEPSRHTLAISLMKAGKHVLIEKPLAESVGEAKTILDAQRLCKVAASVVSQKRFDKSLPFIRQTLVHGALGKPISFDVIMALHRGADYYGGESRWRLGPGGNVIMNNAIHWLDVLNWLFGLPAVVYAVGMRNRHDFLEFDTALISLQYASGLNGTLRVSSAFERDRKDRFVLYGESAEIALEGGSVRVGGSDAERSSKGIWERVFGNREKPQMSFPRGKISHQVNDFLDSIDNGSKPAVTLEDGLRSLLVAECARRSILERNAILIEDIHANHVNT